jgi:hypothetical protein
MDRAILLMCTSSYSDLVMCKVSSTSLCFFELRNVDTIQYALHHRKFSYMIKQKFMKHGTLEDPYLKMCKLVGYLGPLRFTPVMPITGEKLNGPGYPTNMHICIFGSSNVQSFMNY